MLMTVARHHKPSIPRERDTGHERRDFHLIHVDDIMESQYAKYRRGSHAFDIGVPYTSL